MLGMWWRSTCRAEEVFGGSPSSLSAAYGRVRGRKSFATMRPHSWNNKQMYVYGGDVEKVRHWWIEALMAIEEKRLAPAGSSNSEQRPAEN